MKAKKFGNKYVIRIDRGEEIVESIREFCDANDIKLGTVTGIGATNKVTIGILDTNTGKYKSDELTGDYEITSLTGNITTLKGETYLHFHVSLADKDHKAFGGHLNSAMVSATFEGTIEVLDGEIEREMDESVGINLMKL